MAKKRKASKNFEQSPKTKSTKFNIEERFDDSEDEFYAGREKILLDEDVASKRRRHMIEGEKYLQPSDEEILGYEDEDDDESEDRADLLQDEEDDNIQQLRGEKVNGSKRRVQDGEDEELEEEEDEDWGANRADYYNADVIETEADAIEEENEAKRLHQKQMKGMTDADFGFDENEWADDRQSTRQSKAFSEKLPEAQIPANATVQQKLQILRSRYPELEPLAADFLRLQPVKKKLDLQASHTLEQTAKGGKLDSGIPAMVKRDALAAYLASISTYFVILSSRVTVEKTSTISALSPLELHEHAVIQALTRARGLWDRVVDEEIATVKTPPNERSQAVMQDNRSQSNGHVHSIAKEHVKKNFKKATNLADERKSQGSKTEKKSKKILGESLTSKKQKKKSSTNDKVKPLDLNTLMNAAAANELDSESDYGDEQPLTEEQFAEKDRKRKSLRFYTSQIASKANKRGVASREAGGDDDLPYKERQRDRTERLMKAAEARGKDSLDLLNGDMEDDDYDALPNHERPDQNDEYYDHLLNASTKKKAEKKAKAEAYAIAAQEGAEVYEEETVGPDGKRAITYAILKNKGLAPRRKKDVRNPRVKKRKKYDEKLKKLGSMRQVYKGGEGRGGYGGELTGIKTNLVKSVKL